MEIKLEKRPKSPILIEGFPGFGLIGTIVTEFLIKHLNAEPIGKIQMSEIPPVIAVHAGKAVEPLGIFYDKKNNLVILHALASVQGFEWGLVNILADLVKELKVKEVISLEGVGSNSEEKDVRAFYLGTNKKLKSLGIEPLKEGIIVGVTGALLLRKDLPVTCLFAETHSTLPDSRAAAKIVEVLDSYLGLDVDFKPLLQKAMEFEAKLRGIMEKTKSVSSDKKLTYFG